MENSCDGCKHNWAGDKKCSVCTRNKDLYKQTDNYEPAAPAPCDHDYRYPSRNDTRRYCVKCLQAEPPAPFPQLPEKLKYTAFENIPLDYPIGEFLNKIIDVLAALVAAQNKKE